MEKARLILRIFSVMRSSSLLYNKVSACEVSTKDKLNAHRVSKQTLTATKTKMLKALLKRWPPTTFSLDPIKTICLSCCIHVSSHFLIVNTLFYMINLNIWYNHYITEFHKETLLSKSIINEFAIHWARYQRSPMAVVVYSMQCAFGNQTCPSNQIW